MMNYSSTEQQGVFYGSSKVLFGVALLVAAAPIVWGKGKPGGEKDAEQPLEVSIETSELFGIFDDGNGDYLDSDQGTFAGIHLDGSIRIATSGPGVANGGNNRSLTVVLPDGTPLDSGPFDLRTETVIGMPSPWDLDPDDPTNNWTLVNAYCIVDDFEGGSANNRWLYFGTHPGSAADTEGPLVVTRTKDNEWVLEAVSGISKGRIAELVKFRGQFSWEAIWDLDPENPLGAGYLPFRAVLTEVAAAQ